MSRHRTLLATLAVVALLGSCGEAHQIGDQQIGGSEAEPVFCGSASELVSLSFNGVPAADKCSRIWTSCADARTYASECRDGVCECKVNGETVSTFDATCNPETPDTNENCGWHLTR